MEATFELGESSGPDLLRLEDILQSKEDPLTGVSWRLLQSSLLQSKLFPTGLNECAQVHESMTELKEKLQSGESPTDLLNALSTLPSTKPSDSNQFLHQKLSSFPESTSLEEQLKESQQNTKQLTQALGECQQQLNLFKSNMMDAHAIMKELNNNWAREREQAQELREQIQILTSINQAAKYTRNTDSQTSEQAEITELRRKNEVLALQVQRNKEVLAEVTTVSARNGKLKDELALQTAEVQRLRSEKAQVIAIVEELVDAAQRILVNKGPNSRQKLTEILNLLQTAGFRND